MLKFINRSRACCLCQGNLWSKYNGRKTRIIVASSAQSTFIRNYSKELDLTLPEHTTVAQEVLEPITEASQEISTLVQAGEPTLTSLGLGGYTPVGIAQSCLEYLHVSLDIPWWAAILIGTVCVRAAMFPLVIKAQKNSALMHNNMPEMQVLQIKMTQARQSGDHLKAAECAQELFAFMKEKNVNPMKNLLVPLAQAPFFISFFLGLRGMANCPVESMHHGGLYWFMDLTVPDQFFLLPLITSATMWATIELGTDGGAKLNAPNMKPVKYILRALPIIMIPFTINFPGAILVYWCSSNFISLIQVGLLKIPAVREYFKIPKLLEHSPESYPINNKSFTSSAKESWTNLKISDEMAQRARIQELIKNKEKLTKIEAKSKDV